MYTCKSWWNYLSSNNFLLNICHYFFSLKTYVWISRFGRIFLMFRRQQETHCVGAHLPKSLVWYFHHNRTGHLNFLSWMQTQICFLGTETNITTKKHTKWRKEYKNMQVFLLKYPIKPRDYHCSLNITKYSNYVWSKAILNWDVSRVQNWLKTLTIYRLYFMKRNPIYK